ncbi:ECF transporter S component [Peptococcus simiae]|uniref:ECF transporter S component n=1 Tax=Peptococcus simiae TaxID=1643805 RepID=UPI00397FC996
MKLDTKKLSLYAVFIALTCVGTLVIRIPFPLTKGYLNLGDAVLLAAALTMGRTGGLLAGGLGSFLADILTGYVYAPVTLVVKGLEGFVCGVIFEKIPTTTGRVIAVLVGAVVMATGYFIFEIILVGLYPAALSYLANLGQGAAGAILAYLLSLALEKGLQQMHILPSE